MSELRTCVNGGYNVGFWSENGGSQLFGSFGTFGFLGCNALQRREAPRLTGRFYKRHFAALFAVRRKRGEISPA